MKSKFKAIGDAEEEYDGVSVESWVIHLVMLKM